MHALGRYANHDGLAKIGELIIDDGCHQAAAAPFQIEMNVAGAAESFY